MISVLLLFEQLLLLEITLLLLTRVCFLHSKSHRLDSSVTFASHRHVFS